jgi:putative transposase
MALALDAVFVKVNGELCYLWRAVDHDGKVLEAVATAKRDQAGAEASHAVMKKYGAPRSTVTGGLRAYSEHDGAKFPSRGQRDAIPATSAQDFRLWLRHLPIQNPSRRPRLVRRGRFAGASTSGDIALRTRALTAKVSSNAGR